MRPKVDLAKFFTKSVSETGELGIKNKATCVDVHFILIGPFQKKSLPLFFFMELFLCCRKQEI